MYFGMVLYDKVSVLEDWLKGDIHNAKPDGIFFNFVESHEISPVDLLHQEMFDWPVASENAYPLINRVLLDMEQRRPDSLELTALEIALRTIPGFLSQSENERSCNVPVVLEDRRREATLSWFGI